LIGAAPAEATTQSGSRSVPEKGTYSVDFLDLRRFKFTAQAIHGIQPVERCCHSQPREQTIAPGGPTKLGGQTDTNITDNMRSGRDQRPRGRFNANRPFNPQPRIPQNNQTFDSNGPNIKIRGSSAHQIFERYLALAREATASDDRIAAENFYQHAEHYFRIDNARRESNQQGTPLKPTTPAGAEMNSSEEDAREVGGFEPQRDGDDSVSSES
jgi:hypothetical protein